MNDTTDLTTRRLTRRLTRSHDDRMLGGVCGGLAEYAGIDATLVRLLVVLTTLFGFGCGLVAYVACWIVMPTE